MKCQYFEDYNDAITVVAFINKLWDQDLVKFFNINPPEDFDDIMDLVETYMSPTNRSTYRDEVDVSSPKTRKKFEKGKPGYRSFNW